MPAYSIGIAFYESMLSNIGHGWVLEECLQIVIDAAIVVYLGRQKIQIKEYVQYLGKLFP